MKPDNILIEKGNERSMVTDFGIARITDQIGTTSRHEILGTAHFMSPEQASGEPVDGRSDLYSLGVTAYFALTGTLPFEGGTLPAVLARVLSDPAPKLATRRGDLPASLTEAVDRCLAKNPGARFAAGEELAEAIGLARGNTREVPPQIRSLVRMAGELDYGLSLLFVGMLTAPGLIRGLWPEEADTLVLLFGSFLIILALFPFLTIGAARRVLDAGLGWEDLRVAIEQERHARADEATVTIPTARRIRLWRLAGVVLAALGVVGTVLLLVEDALVGPAVLTLVMGLIVLGGVRVMEEAEKRGRSIVAWRQSYGTGLGLAILRGPFGRWVFAIAGKGMREGGQSVPPSAHRTEVVLGDAVDALFEALPDHIRSRFGSVPEAVVRLERDAARLRERERALAQAIVQLAPDHASDAVAARRDAAAAELASAQAAVRDRLAAAVAALESIRIDLLRLQAGVGSMDDLTEDLEKAREINAAVDAELAGKEAVRRLTESSAS